MYLYDKYNNKFKILDKQGAYTLLRSYNPKEYIVVNRLIKDSNGRIVRRAGFNCFWKIKEAKKFLDFVNNL